MITEDKKILTFEDLFLKILNYWYLVIISIFSIVIATIYLEKNKLTVEILNKNYAWFDSGTHESLLKASMYVGDFQKRYGQKISCIEEIAYKNSWISKNDLLILAKKIHNKYYRDYLEGLIN